jgi:hypothetical protein
LRFEQIDSAIVQHHIQAQTWILGEKRRDRVHDVKPGERDTRADADHRRQAGALSTCLEFGVIGRFDCTLCALVEPLAGFGRGQTACRSNEQPNTEPGLELGDGLKRPISISAIAVFPRKSSPSNHFLDRASWLRLALDALFGASQGQSWGHLTLQDASFPSKLATSCSASGRYWSDDQRLYGQVSDRGLSRNCPEC